MKYQLNRGGQDLGSFTLQELRSRRAAGMLNGTEWVRPTTSDQWETLAVVLSRVAPAQMPLSPPPVPSAARGGKTNRLVTGIIVATVLIFLTGAVFVGVRGFQFLKRVQSAVRQGGSDDGVTAARKPVVVKPGTLTEADVNKDRRAFRVRQWLDGYQKNEQRNLSWSPQGVELIEAWIDANYGGSTRTNLPSVPELGDKLVAAGCDDPMLLTIAGVTSVELYESIRRLENAVSGFEQAKYKAYPKLYATVALGNKLKNQSRRVWKMDAPMLDVSALQYLKLAIQDGSLASQDQAIIAEIFLNDWGSDFFKRNPVEVCRTFEDAGEPFKWLALVLTGERNVVLAWSARGSGFSQSVTERGWQDFYKHLGEARQAFTEAWQLKPEWALPASRMIYVVMGDSGADEMREWFDRATSAQIDYPQAWSSMRWGLRPRWHGSPEALLALGVAAVNTGRFDTDVPRKLFDVINDLESEYECPVGQHIYAQPNIWPQVSRMYEGYISAPSRLSERNGWRSAYAVVAHLAGHHDVARTQLEALNWQPRPANLKDWGVDLSMMPLEVAARTGAQGQLVGEAELARRNGNPARALEIYSELGKVADADDRTRQFVAVQTPLTKLEQRLQAGDWVDFLPRDEQDRNWVKSWAESMTVSPGTVELQSGNEGHLLYSRARVGSNFEVRGEFEIVRSSDQAFQAGLVFGMPDCDPSFDSMNWQAFRMKRNATEGEIVSLSHGWTKQQVSRPVKLQNDRNAFSFRFQNGKATASVNGTEVLHEVAPTRPIVLPDGELLLGLGAFNDMNQTVIRYRNLQVRRIPAPATGGNR